MSLPEPAPVESEAEAQRLDKWLWHARLARTRSLAASLVVAGKVRLNRERVTKASHAVKSGDVITATLGKAVRVVRVCGFSPRRGPAASVMALYEELTPAADGSKALVKPVLGTIEKARSEAWETPRAPAPDSRPSKRDRRKITQLKGRDR